MPRSRSRPPAEQPRPSPELVDAYLRDGHVVVRQLLDAAALTAARRHLGALLDARAGAAGAPPPSLVTAPLESDPVLAAIAGQPSLVALASALLRAPAIPFGCTYVLKPPGHGLPALWHQDGHPWRARGIDAAVTLWIALDPAGTDNGCLRVIPRSHRAGARPLRPDTGVASLFGAGLDPETVDADLAVDVVLEPGDASAHHPDLVHGSGANRSPRPRTALAVRFRRAPPSPTTPARAAAGPRPI